MTTQQLPQPTNPSHHHRDAFSRAAIEHINGWNSLLWNDYLNCDAFAAEAIMQAEREEMEYIDAQCAQSLKDAYPAFKARVSEAARKEQTMSSKDIEGKWQTPTVEEQGDNKVPAKPSDSKQNSTGDKPDYARDFSGSGWVQEQPFEVDPKETAEERCSACGKKHHECHCRKHSLIREAGSPREEIHLNLNPRRGSLEYERRDMYDLYNL
ncbi:hypothetical protein NA57DRAFT_58944 [Rhizodiscina lignyota]|uniref:Uncharacterized protein n=1 Tax=Rhizodiscina lignyota TaxID=1504668 RepID=A0A9P4M7I9_9PEZI|nr:hypothetical protein NA57DRAFT_58944 [Rhizodiscina lignyota]